MGTFFLYSPDEIFDDELYETILSIDERFNDIVKQLITAVIGDCIIYNKVTNEIYIRPYLDIEKELESSVIGIVLQTNDDQTVDCIMKNFLTTESLKIPIHLMVREDNQGALATMKQMFDRFISKYQRETNMEFIKDIHYYIPSVPQLDFIWYNLDSILNTISKIYDNDRAILFKERFYNGILTSYKNKLYTWTSKKNYEKREILHLIKGRLKCEFLPCFTIKLV